MNEVMCEALAIAALEHIALADKLKSILSQPIEERDGMFIQKTAPAEISSRMRANLQDRTGLECFINHIHIEDYLDDNEKRTSAGILLQGLTYAISLRQKLRGTHSGASFNIILTQSAESCSVRFHKIRENESWLRNDIEDYTDEGVCLLRT